MRKLLFIASMLVISVVTGALALAGSKAPGDLGREIAQDYIDNSLIDENWELSHPFISDQRAYLTDKNTASYIEYKVSCDDNPNCGWVVVNIDGDDVAIPIASTQGSANFELLSAKLDEFRGNPERPNADKRKKYYYFSPFEQFIEDEDNNVASLELSDRKPAHDDLADLVEKVKIRKKSEDFKQHRRDLEDEGLTAYSRPGFFASLVAKAATTTIPNTFVPGASTTMCGSRIPCYKYDATYAYSTGTCKLGCVPTSLAMIYGYHDRQGTYPNLVTGTAKDYIDDATTDSNITTMINAIRTQVGTTCSGGEGLTPASSAKLGIQYAKDKGYANAVSTYETGSTWILHNSIKAEINASRPVLVGISSATTGHAVVAYGYSSDTTSKMIRVNYGAWRNGTIRTSSNPVTNVSSYNADVNVNSVSLTSGSAPSSATINFGVISSITRIKVGW